MNTLTVRACLLAALMLTTTSATAQQPDALRYLLLATSKTSTMEKEMNEAADSGYRFAAVMGGETAVGGNEVVTIMVRPSEASARYQYKLLATTKTSTMQKEMQEAGDAGFEFRGQTVFKSMFGGQEVAVVLERDREASPSRFEYRLLATKKTSTMQKELAEVGDAGFEFVGMTVSKTGIGGTELVVITRRASE